MYLISIKIYYYYNLEQIQEVQPVPVVLPSRQYTLEELETEIVTKSLQGIDALKTATEAIKGTYIYFNSRFFSKNNNFY
jgi:hypothetical protein